MNIAVSSLMTIGAKPATGKGAPGNPLADFMAMIEKAGLPVDGSGKLDATKLTGLTGESRDAATKLIAQLNAATGNTEGECDETGDPAKTLAALLEKLGGDETDKSKTDTTATDAPTDISGLLAMVSSLVAQEKANAKPVTAAVETVVEGVKTAATAIKTEIKTELAALRTPLKDAKTKGEANGKPTAEAPLSDDGIKAALAKLTALIAPQGDTAETAATTTDKTEKPAAADTAETTTITADEKRGIAELLSRLGLPVKSGAAVKAQAPQPPQSASVTATAPATSAQVAQAAATAQNERKDTDNKPGGFGTFDASASIGTIAANSASQSSPASQAVDAGANAAPAQPANEEMVRHHLDLAKDSQWLDNLARDISRAAQHDAQLRFQLNPEHLGSLKVEVVNGAQGTSVKLTADTEAARAILVDAQPKLIAEARAQGLRISEAHVDLSGQGNSQRHTAEPAVIVRTNNAANTAEIEQANSVASNERYA